MFNYIYKINQDAIIKSIIQLVEKKKLNFLLRKYNNKFTIIRLLFIAIPI